jgi:putative ABC transport system permease protein
MAHLTIILRQVRRSSRQAGLFTLCVALSLAGLTAFSGYARSVRQSLRDDARNLHGADIIIKSYDPLSATLQRALRELVEAGQARTLRVHAFHTMVRAQNETVSVLAGLRVVEPGYPFYGKIALASGRPFGTVLVPGHCIVEQSLLDRMGLAPGARLNVGRTTLTIADIVTAEPGRPTELFSFGPRVFVHAGDLAAMGLVTTGSRIRRVVLVQVPDPGRVEAVARRLRGAALPEQEQVDTYRTAGSRISRFLDNLFFFLNLVGLFILLMAGLGIQGTLGAMFREKQNTIAIMKTLGATDGYMLRHFAGIVAILGAGGIGLGIVCGVLLQQMLGQSLATYLPAGWGRTVSWEGILEGVAMGIGVVALFSYLPLQRISRMRPMMIFRRDQESDPGKKSVILAGAMTAVLFFGLVLWHMRDVRFGVQFTAGMIALVLAAGLPARLMLAGIRRWQARSLVLRRAARGLFRRGNATRSVVITLSASLAVIFANYLIAGNLDATFVRSYPEDAPNAFFVDIQTSQADAFVRAAGEGVALYPIVRARLTAVNGKPVDRQKERRKRRDNLARVFNLTYRHTLLSDERIVRGHALFRPDWPDRQVSVLDTVVKMHPMAVGDTLEFRIQGVPLRVRIASIRTRTEASLAPFFYFVFPESILKDVPQTLFAALKVPPDQLGHLQNRIVSRFPNISVIDMSRTIGVFARLMNRLSAIIRSLSLFSIAAGLLILVSAVYATRAERVAEAVYYKILGAPKGFILRVFALENGLIGLLSGVTGLALAQAGAFWVCHGRLDIEYRLFPLSSVLMIGATVLLVMLVGLTASRSVMDKRPAVFLREQTEGPV